MFLATCSNENSRQSGVWITNNSAVSNLWLQGVFDTELHYHGDI